MSALSGLHRAECIFICKSNARSNVKKGKVISSVICLTVMETIFWISLEKTRIPSLIDSSPWLLNKQIIMSFIPILSEVAGDDTSLQSRMLGKAGHKEKANFVMPNKKHATSFSYQQLIYTDKFVYPVQRNSFDWNISLGTARRIHSSCVSFNYYELLINQRIHFIWRNESLQPKKMTHNQLRYFQRLKKFHSVYGGQNTQR